MPGSFKIIMPFPAKIAKLSPLPQSVSKSVETIFAYLQTCVIKSLAFGLIKNLNLSGQITASKMMFSDQTTSIAILKNEVRAFIEARDWDQFHAPKDLAIGLITEASEFLEHFRFRSEAEVETLLMDPTFSQNLQHELADCFYFILAISHKLEFDLSQALQAKMAISAERYPEQLAAGRNVKYTEL